LVLRVNAECNCSGPADIAIGPMHYRDNHNGQAVQQAFRPNSPSHDTAAAPRFQARPGQAISQNTQRFPVTADDPFTLQVPMRATLASAGSGYVALIFLDAQNKEIERLRIPFTPVQHPIGTVTTDAQGRFSLLPDPDTLRASVGFDATFQGDPQHRMAEATVR